MPRSDEMVSRFNNSDQSPHLSAAKKYFTLHDTAYIEEAYKL